jgi:hypothetical protein
LVLQVISAEQTLETCFNATKLQVSACYRRAGWCR